MAVAALEAKVPATLRGPSEAHPLARATGRNAQWGRTRPCNDTDDMRHTANRASKRHHSSVTGVLAGGLLVVDGLAVGAHGFEPSALPLIATGLYIVMALGIRPLDRVVGAAAPTAMASAEDPLVMA